MYFATLICSIGSTRAAPISYPEQVESTNAKNLKSDIAIDAPQHQIASQLPFSTSFNVRIDPTPSYTVSALSPKEARSATEADKFASDTIVQAVIANQLVKRSPTPEPLVALALAPIAAVGLMAHPKTRKMAVDMGKSVEKKAKNLLSKKKDK